MRHGEAVGEELINKVLAVRPELGVFELGNGVSVSLADQAEVIDGKEFYGYLAMRLGSKKAASELLYSVGIKGVKYLDDLAQEAGRETYNYVIFNDKDVSITRYKDATSGYEWMDVGSAIGNEWAEGANFSFSRNEHYVALNDNVGLNEHLGERVTPIEVNFTPERKGANEWMSELKAYIRENLAGKVFSIGQTGKRVMFLSGRTHTDRAVKGVRSQKRVEAGKKLEEVIEKAYQLSSSHVEHKTGEGKKRDIFIDAADRFEVFGYPIAINGELCVLWFAALHKKGVPNEDLAFYQFGVAEKYTQKERQELEKYSQKEETLPTGLASKLLARAPHTAESLNGFTLGEVVGRCQRKDCGDAGNCKGWWSGGLGS